MAAAQHACNGTDFDGIGDDRYEDAEHAYVDEERTVTLVESTSGASVLLLFVGRLIFFFSVFRPLHSTYSTPHFISLSSCLSLFHDMIQTVCPMRLACSKWSQSI